MGDGDDWACSVVKTYSAGMLSENIAPLGKVYRAQGEWAFIENEDGRWNSGIIWTVSRESKTGRSRTLRGGLAKWGSVGVFGDHNPREYECVLELLAKGLCND